MKIKWNNDKHGYLQLHAGKMKAHVYEQRHDYSWTVTDESGVYDFGDSPTIKEAQKQAEKSLKALARQLRKEIKWMQTAVDKVL